jgi:hypothetical protein
LVDPFAACGKTKVGDFQVSACRDEEVVRLNVRLCMETKS